MIHLNGSAPARKLVLLHPGFGSREHIRRAQKWEVMYVGKEFCGRCRYLQESKAVKRLGLMTEALHGLLEVSGTMSYMSL